MDPADLTSEGPRAWEHQEIDRWKCDDFVVKEKNVLRSRFRDCGFKGARIEDCSFNHSHFENCYFRKTEFTRVSLVGCEFTSCRFDEAVFAECVLDHADFQNCSVQYRQLRNTLPKASNLLREVARSLRVNAQGRGFSEDARSFLMEELRASGEHHRRVAFDWEDSFYGRKYKPEQRLRGFGKFLLHMADLHVWGHGEYPGRVVVSSAVLVSLFGFLYWLGGFSVCAAGSSESTLGFIDSVGYSAAAFATMNYGQFVACSQPMRLVTALESAFGLVFFGLLVASLYRKVSRR